MSVKSFLGRVQSASKYLWYRDEIMDIAKEEEVSPFLIEHLSKGQQRWYPNEIVNDVEHFERCLEKATLRWNEETPTGTVELHHVNTNYLETLVVVPSVQPDPMVEIKVKTEKFCQSIHHLIDVNKLEFGLTLETELTDLIKGYLK